MRRSDWVLLAFLLLLPAEALIRIRSEPAAIWLFGGLLLGSVIGFVLVWWDKRRAGKSGRRIPEKVLHLVEVAGGWPGSFVGQKVFRHKTLKRRYRLVFWLIVLGWQSVLAALAWRTFGG